MMDNVKLLLGAHTSIAGGVFNALKEGVNIGATTIQMFTANQKQWKGKPLDQTTIDLWNKTLAESAISQVMSHDSYLINLGSPDPEILGKSRTCFSEEIQRCLHLGLSYLNFHPGASIKSDEQQCLDTIVESLLSNKKNLENSNLRLLLEATAGQGSSLGWRFEHLAYIIDRTKDFIPIGVCIDTCHIFAAGYDIRTPEAWDNTLKEFDRIVGLYHLYAFHLNDSLKGLGSRVDRHAPLGKGLIGIDSFAFLMRDKRTRNLPKYLETPDGPPLWKEEIALLRSF